MLELITGDHTIHAKIAEQATLEKHSKLALGPVQDAKTPKPASGRREGVYYLRSRNYSEWECPHWHGRLLWDIVIDSKGVKKRKTDAHRDIVKQKARFIANGFTRECQVRLC